MNDGEHGGEDTAWSAQLGPLRTILGGTAAVRSTARELAGAALRELARIERALNRNDREEAIRAVYAIGGLLDFLGARGQATELRAIQNALLGDAPVDAARGRIEIVRRSVEEPLFLLASDRRGESDPPSDEDDRPRADPALHRSPGSSGGR